MNLFLKSLTEKPFPWLAERTDVNKGVVIASNVSLSRNIRPYNFPDYLPENQQEEIVEKVFRIVEELPMKNKVEKFKIFDLSNEELSILEERFYKCSNSKQNFGGGIILEKNEKFVIYVNFDDHLTFESQRNGLQIDKCWKEIEKINDAIAEKIDYSFDLDLGYLTSSLSLVGTGLKISVYLDLTASFLCGQIPDLEKGAEATGYKLFSDKGKQTDAASFFATHYFLEYRQTLGMSENEALNDFKSFVNEVITCEIRARKKLLCENPAKLYDHISRAYGELKHAYLMESREAWELIMTVRTGVNLGLFSQVAYEKILFLMQNCGDVHFKVIGETQMMEYFPKISIARAYFIKKILAN